MKRYIFFITFILSIWNYSLYADLKYEYRMDEYSWDTDPHTYEVEERINDDNASATDGAIPADLGVLCEAGNMKSSHHLLPKDGLEFGDEYTITLWAKFPLSDKNHAIYDDKYQYYNIADRDGSNNDFIFFAKDTTNNKWYWCVDDASCNDFTMPSDGWHHLAFTIKKVGWFWKRYYTYLYVDGDKNDSMKGAVRNDKLTILFDSDYQNTEGNQTIGAITDEFKLFDTALSDDDISNIYKNEKSGKNWDGSQRVCPFPPLVGGWRMDECYWDGTNGEVLDSSQNLFNGTAQIANTEINSSEDGLTCQDGDFTHISQDDSDDSDDDFVELPKEAMDGLKNFTVTTWIKTSQSGSHKRFTLLSAARATTTYNETWIFFSDKNRFYPWIKGKRNGTIKLDNDLNDNKWHNVIVTREDNEDDNNSIVCIVIDGNTSAKKCKTIDNSQGSLSVAGLVLAQDQDKVLGDYENHQEFNGYMDEVNIFGHILNDSLIKRLYNNESARKTYDGNSINCHCCATTPTELEVSNMSLNNTYNTSTWTHISFQNSFSTPPVIFFVADNKGGDPASIRVKNITKSGFDASIVEPEGEDGPHVNQTVSYIAINKGIHKIGRHYFNVGTIKTNKVQGKNAPSGSNIGWENINECVDFQHPVILSNIQTLNNLDSNPPSEPLKPWGTAVIDDAIPGNFKLAIDMSETDAGSFDKNETVAYIVSGGNIQDEFTDSNGKEIKYETILTDRYFKGWDNGCKSVDYINSYSKKPYLVGWKETRKGKNGGWFRKCEENTTSVGFVVDEDRASDSERRHTKESGGIFIFSDNTIIGSSKKSAFFNAVSQVGNICNASEDWDNNLTTQIVNNSFSLYILSKDSETNSSTEANITKVSLYYYLNGDDKQCSGDSYKQTVLCDDSDSNIPDCNDTNANGCMSLNSIKIDSAVKCVRVYIKGSENNNTEENESNATDDFAIRPKNFTFLISNNNIKAGENFTIDFKALDNDGNPSSDYNETNGTSFDINESEIKSECIKGDFKIDDINFSDGESGNVDANYSEVGELNITIFDKNGSEFAKVDSDDTNDTARLIEQYSKTIKFSPHHFEIDAILNNFDSDNNFTYLSKDLNMSSKLNLTITAKNEENDTTNNFIAECYAKDLNISISHTPISDDNISYLGYVLEDANDSNSSENWDNQKNDNIDFTLKEGNFSTENAKVDTNGSTKISIYFNFDRNNSLVVNPFDLNISNITIENEDRTLDNEGNNTFVYGRLFTQDIDSSQLDSKSSIYLLIYDNNSSDIHIANLYQLRLNWWIYKYSNKAEDGDILDYNATSSLDLGSQFDNNLDINFNSPSNGKIGVNISNSEDKSRTDIIHLDIPIWLWYSMDNIEYNYKEGDSNSTCSKHPCFIYQYKSTKNKGEVDSGEYGGSDFNITEGNNTKHGVKLFR